MRRDRVRLLRLLVQELTNRLNRYAPLEAHMHGLSLQEWLRFDSAGRRIPPAQHAAVQRDFNDWQRLQRELALVETLRRQYRELLGPEPIDGAMPHPYNERIVQQQELPPAE